MNADLQRYGHIHDDLTAIGNAIYQAAFVGTVSVWVDDIGHVRGCCEGVPDDVPTHWIAGTFAAGTMRDDIVDDLRALLRERAKDWILD